jgi:hypothetical protein
MSATHAATPKLCPRCDVPPTLDVNGGGWWEAICRECYDDATDGGPNMAVDISLNATREDVVRAWNDMVEDWLAEHPPADHGDGDRAYQAMRDQEDA